MKKSWYSIAAQADGTATVDIFDDIGLWGITAKDFMAELKALGAVKTINVRINSYGGDVFDGIAIYNALKFHEAAVNVTVYGLAASIASVIAMAGDVVAMPENTFLFVHNPIAYADVLALADAAKMREIAEELDAIAQALDKTKYALIRSYASKSGQADEEIAKLMDAETWLTAADAKELGFADQILEPVKLAARADIKRYKNLPARLAALVEKPEPEPNPTPEPAPGPPAATPELDLRAAALEITELCKKNGVPELAGDFIAAGTTAAKVAERLMDGAAIRAVCLASGFPDRAQRYIKGGYTLAEARADLLEAVLARDPSHIDSRLGPAGGRPATVAVVIDTPAIYRQRRAGGRGH